MGSLDDALALHPLAPGRWRATADPDHESANGMFGGWTAAVSLAAVLASADGSMQPSALTVNFASVVAPGSAPVVHVQHLGGSRSVGHWRADLRSSDEGELLATATAVLTARRPTDEHVQWTMPAAPEPESMPEFHAPGRQGATTDLRVVTGDFGAFGKGDTRTSAWIRTVPERPVDHLLLAYLSDQFAPRSFFWGAGGPRPSATLTMSVYFHATADELAEAGSDYLLNEATGSRGSHATSGQHGRFWSRGGVLLATTEQLAWYR